MEGTLSFEEDPIVIDISKELGTRYTFEAITLESGFGIEMPGSEGDESTTNNTGSTTGTGSKKGSAFDVEPTVGVKM